MAVTESVSRTLIGALIIVVMTVGPVMLNIQSFWQFRMPDRAPG
jgi:predicted ABC-type sugar transport system permease subunit